MDSVLQNPRPEPVETALTLSHRWSEHHTIDELPAHDHAFRTARKVEIHAPRRAPEDPPPLHLIAAALLHHAPALNPAGSDLDAILTAQFGAAVTRIVRAVDYEQRASQSEDPYELDTSQPDAILVSTASKIISITALVHHAQVAGDKQMFWNRHGGFLRRVPRLRQFADAAAPHLPETVSWELEQAVDIATQTTEPYRAS